MLLFPRTQHPDVAHGLRCHPKPAGRPSLRAWLTGRVSQVGGEAYLQLPGSESKSTAGLAGESTIAATTSLKPGASCAVWTATVPVPPAIRTLEAMTASPSTCQCQYVNIRSRPIVWPAAPLLEALLGQLRVHTQFLRFTDHRSFRSANKRRSHRLRAKPRTVRGPYASFRRTNSLWSFEEESNQRQPL